MDGSAMPPPELLDRVRERICANHCSQRAEEACLHSIALHCAFTASSSPAHWTAPRRRLRGRFWRCDGACRSSTATLNALTRFEKNSAQDALSN